jgi:hypothetical protein
MNKELTEDFSQRTQRKAKKVTDTILKLHSRYDPQGEARRYIEALKIDPDINCFILIEPGIGYMIPVLQKNHPNSKIVVLHADASFRELPDAFTGDAAWYADSKAGVQEFLEAEVPLDGSVRIVEWRPSLNVYGDKILAIVHESAEFIKRLEAGRRTGAFFGKRWMRNFFRNMDLFQKTIVYRKMNIPIVIIGSGPGLEEVIPQICAQRENIFVLAASSSLAALAARGIAPDMVISTDGGPWALLHLHSFFRHLTSKRVILALSLCAAAPSQCSGIPLLAINDGSLWQGIALNAAGIPSVLIPQRGTVTACALELALELSGGNIFLAGMDLSVSDIRSHARPNAFDPLLFGGASRLQPVYNQYFIRSGAIKAGKSLDVYAAWFKTRLGSLPKRIFSIGPNHEVFGSLARETLFTDNANSRAEAEDHFKPEKQAAQGRARRAAQALTEALGDMRYAPTLIAELSPLLFPSRKDVQAAEIAMALEEVAKNSHKEHEEREEHKGRNNGKVYFS